VCMDFKMLKVKVPIIFSGTQGWTLVLGMANDNPERGWEAYGHLSVPKQQALTALRYFIQIRWPACNLAVYVSMTRANQFAGAGIAAFGRTSPCWTTLSQLSFLINLMTWGSCVASITF
jgi:hypothetical protein